MANHPARGMAERLGERVRSVLLAVGAALYALTVIMAAMGISFMILLTAAAIRGGGKGSVDLAVTWLEGAIPWIGLLGALSAFLYRSYRRRSGTAGIFAFFMANVLAAGAGGFFIAWALR